MGANLGRMESEEQKDSGLEFQRLLQEETNVEWEKGDFSPAPTELLLLNLGGNWGTVGNHVIYKFTNLHVNKKYKHLRIFFLSFFFSFEYQRKTIYSPSFWFSISSINLVFFPCVREHNLNNYFVFFYMT